MRALVCVLAVGLVAAAPQDAPPQVFRAAAHAVSLDVAVILEHYVVNWLKPEAFAVSDDGVPQTITSVDRHQLPIDLRVVIDTSGSITAEGLARYQAAMRQVAGALRPGDRSEIVGFTKRAVAAAPPQAPPIAIDLRRELPDGTSFFDAVTLALVAAPAADRRRLVIVLSDAQDNASFLDETALMDVAKRTDSVVYTVLPVVSSAVLAPYVARLQALSLVTGGRLIPAYRDAQIGSILTDAINEFRNCYRLRYTLRAPIRRGWHPVTVKVTGEYKYIVRTRPGYFLE